MATQANQGKRTTAPRWLVGLVINSTMQHYSSEDFATAHSTGYGEADYGDAEYGDA
jgi:hypothetical protein